MNYAESLIAEIYDDGAGLYQIIIANNSGRTSVFHVDQIKIIGTYEILDILENFNEDDHRLGGANLHLIPGPLVSWLHTLSDSSRAVPTEL